MKYQPDEEFRKHLNQQGVRGKRFKLDPKKHAETLARFREWHPSETEEQLEQRVAHKLIWDSRRTHNAKWYLKWLAIGAALLLLILAGSSRAEAQVDCVKWQASDSSTVGNFCAPFKVKAGTNVSFSKSGTTLTVDVSVGASTPPYINVLHTCAGIVGDGSTDDGAAIQACFDSYPGRGFFFPQTIAHGCSYLSNQTLYPKGNGVQIVGQSGSQYLDDVTPGHLGGTEICFPTGITGFWLDISATEGEASQGSAIRNLSLRGAAGFRSLSTPTGLNVPGTLPQFTRNISAIQRASNVLTVSITGVGGIEGLTQQVGSTVNISGVTGDSTMNGLCIVSALSNTGTYGDNPTTFTCPQNGSDSGPFTTPGTVSLPTTGASTADGIRVCSNFWTIDHVGVIGFERHGINGDSQAGHGCALAFSDDMVIHDSMFMENNGDGFYCQGVDCNAGYMSGNTYYYNFLYGIEDQSSLGNTHVGEQISNNGSGWAAATTPATKNITSVTRTSGTVAVVLASGDTSIKLGSCIVIAGVTDTSFNTTSGQCFFVTSFTNSTHYSYIQPGAPADASSSSGTSRMAKFAEAYLSSGVDSGAEKIATQSPVSVPTIVGNYAEGGQICKNGPTALHVGGVSGGCAAAASGNWTGQILGSGGVGLGGQGYFTLSAIDFPKDSSHTINVRAGVSADQNTIWTYLNHSNGIAWQNTVSPAGTNGGTGYMEWRSGLGQTRMMFVGNTTSGHTYFNSEGTGAVKFNFNFAGTNAGTGGVEFYSGGASPAKVASVDSSGKGTFTALADTTFADVTEIAAPSNPSAGVNRLYADSTAHTLKCLTSSGGSCFPTAGSSALLDGSVHTDTLAGSVTRGDVIIGNSTPKWARLAIGTTGKYLKSDGTDLAYSTGAASGTGACGANSWASTLNGDAAPTCTQPAFSNISGSVTDAQVPDNITVSLAATATALAANGANCSGNNFALGVDASGVGECAQPAFSNLSGSATAAQLPNPTATTLGGIESLASAASKWINTISTSGVPSATQPAFTDISGSVAASQMPALTGDCTTGAGAVAVTCTQINGANFTVNSSGLPTKVDGITTAGQGVSVVQCITSAKAETGADASVLSCTPASAVGAYEVCVSMAVSAASTATLGWTLTWTDSKTHANAPTNMSLYQMGVAAPALTFSAAANNDYYACVPINVSNAGTAIVVKTTFSGTSIAYNITATIVRTI